MNHTHLTLGFERKLQSGDLRVNYQFDHQRVQLLGALTKDQLNNRQQANYHNLHLRYRHNVSQNWKFQLNNLFNVMTVRGLFLGSTPYDYI